jgi:hypothetical protein
VSLNVAVRDGSDVSDPCVGDNVPVGDGVGGGVIVRDGELDFVGVMSFDAEPYE